MAFALVCCLCSALCTEKYFELKENKLQVEYRSLYSLFNKALIPNPFQEEMGIPKLVYEIGERFPIVVSISDKLQGTARHKSKDDSDIPTERKRKKRRMQFFSHSERQSPEVLPESLINSSFAVKMNMTPDPQLLQEAATSDLELKSSLIKTYNSTKERIVKMLLNINEKVSPKAKRMKEASKVRVHDLA